MVKELEFVPTGAVVSPKTTAFRVRVTALPEVSVSLTVATYRPMAG